MQNETERKTADGRTERTENKQKLKRKNTPNYMHTHRTQRTAHTLNDSTLEHSSTRPKLIQYKWKQITIYVTHFLILFHC